MEIAKLVKLHLTQNSLYVGEFLSFLQEKEENSPRSDGLAQPRACNKSANRPNWPAPKSLVEIMSGPITKEHAFVVIAKNSQIIEKIIGVRSPYKYPAQSNMLLQKFTNPSLVNGKQKLHEALQIFF